MLKWTTRGSLNDSDSSHAHFSTVEKSTLQAYSSVMSQLSKVSNPGPVHVDSADAYHSLSQGQQKPHGSSRRQPAGSFMVSTSPPGRRPFLARLKRSSSLSRGERSVVDGQSLRYASSRSLPSSPQNLHNAPDGIQKKTGVLGKFKKLFRTAKSVNKVYKVDTATAGKFSPGPARRRSQSPLTREDTGNVKRPSCSKSRLTRLIASKRSERKQTRSNFSIQKSVLPQKSESMSSAEEHPYVQHSQVDKTLFLQNEPILGPDAPERTGSDLPPSRVRQNQQRHRQSVNSTALARNIRFSELGANIQCRQGQVACLQRSSSLRSSIDAHGFKCSKAGVFDPKSPNISLEYPQRRRWSSQSTNIWFRSNETECQPASSKLPICGSGLVSQLANKQSCSDDSLFKFGESLMTMLELGSLKKVKVMPSQPDIIIQARKSLSPVYKNLPLGSPQDDAITPRKTRQDVKEKFQWSVTDDGAMLITPITKSCKPDKINHKQSDLVTPDNISWPRNNNNGRVKMYNNTIVHHMEQETDDAIFDICEVSKEDTIHDEQRRGCAVCAEDICKVSKEDTIHDEQRRGCAVCAEGNDTELVTTEHNKMSLSCESPLSSYGGTEQKCELSRVRVKDIVKSIEEQCEGINKRSFPDYQQAALVSGDGLQEAEFDSHRSTDDGHGSDSTVVMPPGWVQETRQDGDNKVKDICATSPVVTRRHNYSSGESQGFSPKVCFSDSEARSSVHITFNGRAVVHDDSNMQSRSDSEVCDSSAGNRTSTSPSPQSSYTPSIPSDMINDTWTFPSDVFSDSSNVDSLVRNIALTNKASKSAPRTSTPNQNDKICDRLNETDKSPMGKRLYKKVVRNEKLEKCDNESQCEDSTRESLTSHSQRDDTSHFSPLLFTNNQEEGITDVKVPVILQDSSLLDAIVDSTMDMPVDQLAEEGSHNQLNSSSVDTMLQPSLILSAIAETHNRRSSLLPQKSPVLGHSKDANLTTSEMEQTESMRSTQSVSEQSGLLQTTDFKWEQDDPDSLANLQRGQTEPIHNQHLSEGETERLTPPSLQQVQVSLVMSTFVQGTTVNCSRSTQLQESIEPTAILEWETQGLASSSSQVGNTNISGDFGSEDSQKETNKVHEYGESLKQTNGKFCETTLPEPTQQTKHVQTVQSTNMFSGNSDCIHSKHLQMESLIQSSLQCEDMEISTPRNILFVKEESLQPTDSLDGQVASPGVATEYGSRSGDGKRSPIVKPKKKVSFNLDKSQQDSSSSSLSGVAVIEVVPRMRVPPDGQTSTGDAAHDLGQTDTISSTDVSGSFSLGSDDGQGLKQQATSSSGDDLTWWGPDLSEDINFLHDEVDEKDIKETEDTRIFDAKEQTANSELSRQHGVLHDAGRKYSSATSLPENDNIAGAIQSNQLINTTTDIFAWLHNGIVESAPDVSPQTITGKKGDDNKDANGLFAVNRVSDKHVQEQSLQHSTQHSTASCMQTPKKPSKYRDGSVPLAGSAITNEGEHARPADSSTSNEDENVRRTYSDITKDDRSFHRTDSDMINEDKIASLSDSNSLTYDVFGTLAKPKKVTTPWWELPVTPATDERGPENVASAVEGCSKLSDLLNSQEAIPATCRLSDCLPQSPLLEPTSHAGDTRSEKGRALTANHTQQAFEDKDPLRERPDICQKQQCQQDNPNEHGDRRTVPTTGATFVQPRSSGESIEYSGRSAKAFPPEKRQATFSGERRPFVLEKLCNTPEQLRIVKTNNDGIKASCDGETRVFDSTSPRKSDNPATVRTRQPGYSSKAQGPNEVAANKTRACNTRVSKKHQPRDFSSPEDAIGTSHLLPGVAAQSQASTGTKHGDLLAHTNCRSDLKHRWRSNKRQGCEVINALQQPCLLGDSHTFLEAKSPPAQTSPCKSAQHVSLVAKETVAVTSLTENRDTVTRQTSPYSPRNQPKCTSTQNMNSFNCVLNARFDGGMDFKKGQSKNRKYNYEFDRHVLTRDLSQPDGLPVSYMSHEHLTESSSSESENRGNQRESQQQCPLTCSLGTKSRCRQRPSDTGGCSSHTELDDISRDNSSTSQHSQGDWSHSSESARGYMARPSASKPHYNRKSSLTGSRSQYTNMTRSDPLKTRHRNNLGSSSPASQHIHSSWFDAPQSQPSYKGRGNSATDRGDSATGRGNSDTGRGDSCTGRGDSATGRGDSSTTSKSRLDSQPGQWLFIATFFVFQIFLHWLYAR